jgi:hypothetical protein
VLQTAACIRLFVALFVDGLPSPNRLESPGYTAAVHRLLSAVHRLTGWKARATACGLPSAVPIRLFVPLFVEGHPHRPSSNRRLPSAVRRLSCGLPSGVFPTIPPRTW